MLELLHGRAGLEGWQEVWRGFMYGLVCRLVVCVAPERRLSNRFGFYPGN